MERAFLTTGVEKGVAVTAGLVALGARVERGLSASCPATALLLAMTVHIPFTDTQINGT
ncbi:MAG TPA: hypothetical protein VNH22_12585 [Blastocatellia bacterium]|jgi:hypothetical protein|nr:hypothetical protein [Blastocatellia bacterium]